MVKFEKISKKEISEESKDAKKKSKKKLKFHKMKSQFPTLNFESDRDIAMDFATKVYKKFSKMIKSIIHFGSTVKHTSNSTSDIDVIIIIDDASIGWDEELIAWYREELRKIIQNNPYNRELHINTTKLTVWWKDLLMGDPVVINILRYGEELIDFGGFFTPLKSLLQQGMIHSTPEAVYTALNRAPQHLERSRIAELTAVEGLYWTMVDSAHALLMTVKEVPPSPEHVPIMLKELFVDKGLLKMDYVTLYRDVYVLNRKIIHGEVTDMKGSELEVLQDKARDFLKVMTNLINEIIKEREGL